MLACMQCSGLRAIETGELWLLGAVHHPHHDGPSAEATAAAPLAQHGAEWVDQLMLGLVISRRRNQTCGRKIAHTHSRLGRFTARTVTDCKALGRPRK